MLRATTCPRRLTEREFLYLHSQKGKPLGGVVLQDVRRVAVVPMKEVCPLCRPDHSSPSVPLSRCPYRDIPRLWRHLTRAVAARPIAAAARPISSSTATSPRASAICGCGWGRRTRRPRGSLRSRKLSSRPVLLSPFLAARRSPQTGCAMYAAPGPPGPPPSITQRLASACVRLVAVGVRAAVASGLMASVGDDTPSAVLFRARGLHAVRDGLACCMRRRTV